jgi:hypothetical protein
MKKPMDLIENVVAPTAEGEGFKNPTNAHVFNYIRDTYGLDKFLDDSTETNLKFFGYGFSGSGKTFTLLQGSSEDPSLLTQTIDYVKKQGKPVEVEVDIFYPKEDNTQEDTEQFYAKQAGAKMQEEIDTIVSNY